MNKKQLEDVQRVIKQPKKYKIGGIIMITVYPLCWILIPLLPTGFSYIKLFAILSMFLVPTIISSLVFFLLSINWKIEIYYDKFTYTNLFKKSRTYKFSEIDTEFSHSGLSLYKDAKIIVTIRNYSDLLAAIEKSKE